jgi:hypothetical protein
MSAAQLSGGTSFAETTFAGTSSFAETPGIFDETSLE